eukprot:5710538-Pyramimonas_sp.AAC.1
MATDGAQPVGAAWTFLSRDWSKSAVAAAKQVAINAGTELKEPGVFGRNLSPRWVDASRELDDETHAKLIAEGRQWMTNNSFLTVQYHGEGLHARVDFSVKQARELVRDTPVDIDAISQFLDEDNEDLEAAVS